MKAHALIEWEGIRARIVELYRHELSHDEVRKILDSLVMFKAVLRGQWHNLSTAKLEEALHQRVDFRDFCGPDLPGNVPDANGNINKPGGSTTVSTELPSSTKTPGADDDATWFRRGKHRPG
jgi:hypothetical protein